MKIVSVILARGGSKGIPKKNILDVKGRPLISYTIQASNQSIVDETWVSSDSDEILEIAKQFNARVIKRPDEISGDSSKSEDALKHFTSNVHYDIMVFIQPTSPLITYHYINAGINKLLDENYDSVFTAYKEHWIPRWEENKPHNWDINNRPMRQDVNELWVENGAFYITTKEAFEKSNLRYSGNIGILEMKQSESFQIDTYDDIKIIENLL